MSLIETIRGCFGRKETKTASLTDAERYRIWGLRTDPVFEVTVTSNSSNFGEIPPGMPGYIKDVAVRKAELLLEYPVAGYSILEKRVIDPLKRTEDLEGKTVLIVVPISPTPKAV